MKLRISLLLAVVFLNGACQRARLSPVVLQSPSEEKSVKPVAKASPSAVSKSVVKGAEKSDSHAAPVVQQSKAGGGVPTVAKVESKEDRVAEAARLAAKKKRAAAARRAQARRLAAASLEAGRQLLREEQNAAALRAFRESVRLNSQSPEAWMGIAFVCERSGKTKDAVEAFKEAKKLWGM